MSAHGETNRWGSHAWLGRGVRFGIFAIPFVASVVVAFVVSGLLPGASSIAGNVVRVAGVVLASATAMLVVDRLARRLMPLSALLHLTLVFPDRAPSRFRIAMRTSSTADLEERIAAAQVAPEGETSNEAAERLLELVGLLSHHDRLTRGHSERVRAYTQVLGEELGLTPAELDKIRWAGLLHDVGKTMIPQEILNKPGRLTDEEFEVVKMHPDEGRSLVAPLADWLGDSLRAVWEHHEKFDGTGYPAGLAGLDISIGARIVAVADTFDVITSARSYKEPMSAAEARAELARCAGTQFDPVVVRAFLNISLGRLRWMAGPGAWLAQFALLDSGGVVHAGDSGASAAAGAAGAGGTTTAASVASTAGAGAATAAATGGASGFASALAVVSAGVTAGTISVVADEPPPPPPQIEALIVEDLVVESPASSGGQVVSETAPSTTAPVSMPSQLMFAGGNAETSVQFHHGASLERVPVVATSEPTERDGEVGAEGSVLNDELAGEKAPSGSTSTTVPEASPPTTSPLTTPPGGGASNGNGNGASNGNGNGASNGNGDGASNGNGSGASNGNGNGASNRNGDGATNGNGDGATNGNGDGATNGNGNGASNGNGDGASNGNGDGASNGNGSGA
ncbi:MAG: HD domain-containing phosphohydrolase [Ilumatobacter sp.]